MIAVSELKEFHSLKRKAAKNGAERKKKEGKIGIRNQSFPPL